MSPPSLLTCDRSVYGEGCVKLVEVVNNALILIQLLKPLR